jgi:diguanylate cyclase (GGDEF)-like protein
MSTLLISLAALLVGAILGAILSGRRSRAGEASPGLESGDVPQMMDLLRRANGAMAACFVAPDAEPAWAAYEPLAGAVADRATAVARLALGDAGDHKVSEAGSVFVAAGDGRIGCALVFTQSAADAIDLERANCDIRRLLAGLREHRLRESGVLQIPRDIPEWLTNGPETVEGIAAQLCEEVHGVSSRPSALVLRDAGAKRVSIVAVSTGADRRLVGFPVSSYSAAGRASSGDVPIAGKSGEDLLGERKGDRRAREEEGIAFPLRDGREGIGSLIVFGQPDAMPERVREHIAWLVANAGPKLGRATTVRAAESRATTDELTGLANRRALERAMAAHGDGDCSVLCVDLDHFKKLNDGFGHAAGDAALRHVAVIFRNALREDDIPCRMGGEEFALWLPGVPANRALEVADRVLSAVRGSVLEWGGAELPITCSIGVAAVPDTVSRIENLLAAADVALYRAKDEGRDRVVLAKPGHGSP